MIQTRALAPAAEPCCLPTPHRIFHYVAGMAFNFSKIEMAHHGNQRRIQQAQPVGMPSDLAESA